MTWERRKMTWDDVKEQILKEDKDGTLTWDEVKKQVKKEKEAEDKKWEEIGKSNAEKSERLGKKLIFVTRDSIKFTRDEYDKLKTAYCKGKGWSLDYPYTVSVRSITLKGSYKGRPTPDVEFCIEIEA